MRLKKEIRIYIKETMAAMFPESSVYLFGSRTDNNKRGGDIDVLLISESKIDKRKIRLFKVEFYKKFGWQKIDVVNFTNDENSVFKKMILNNAVSI